MEPEEIHRRVLWELVHEDAKPLPIIFEKLGQTGEVHTDWKRGNVAPIFKNGKKKDNLGNWVSCLASVPGKITKQIFL